MIVLFILTALLLLITGIGAWITKQTADRITKPRNIKRSFYKH